MTDKTHSEHNESAFAPIATKKPRNGGYDKLAANDLAFVQLVSIRLWLPADESILEA